MDRDKIPSLEWREGVPVSTQFDDPYFSLNGGLEETQHVFLAGNDLPARFAPDFHIAELGFGTGLNMLAAWQVWEASGTKGKLHFTSFEAFPMPKEDMASALGHFPSLRSVTEAFLDAWQGPGHLEISSLRLTVIKGDAAQTLPLWEGMADAWFLDGFNPAKNPEIWTPELMQAVAEHTNPKGTFATYTAAGAVRRGLEAAGFNVIRLPGFAHKRHMSCGVLM